MKKIAIIGASYLQLPLVLKAKAMQLEVHCFAWEDGAVCKDYCDFFYPVSVLDKETILAICEEKKIDGITTIATDIAIPTISYVAQKLGLVANSVDSAAMATNKVLMRECFDKGHVRIPNFVEVETYDPGLFQNFTFPIIIKPVDRSGSRGVSKVESHDGLETAVSKAVAESIVKKAIAEEFIEGDEVSVESISWKGRHYILTITDKVTTGSPHFVELEHHQPSSLPTQIQDKIRSETIKVLDAVAVEFGAGHAEFKITAGGEVFAIEVGARMGGDFIGSNLTELSTGYDFLKGVIDVALNSFEVPKIEALNHSGVYFLCKETAALLPYFEKKNTFEVQKEKTGTELKSVTNSNDRSGYLIYKSDQRILLQ